CASQNSVMAARPAVQPRIKRLDVASIHDRYRHTLLVEQPGGIDRHRYQLASREQQGRTALAQNLPLTDRQNPWWLRLGIRRNTHRTLRETDRKWGIAGDRGVDQVPQLLGITGSSYDQPRHRAQERQVEDAVMRGSVVTRDPGAVEDERHGQPMQAD